MNSLDEAVETALNFFKENNLPIPTNAVEYIAKFPKGMSRQAIKGHFNLTTAEFVKLLNPSYTPPKNAKDRALEEAARLHYKVISDVYSLTNNRDKLDLKCLDCGYVHSTTITSLSGSKLGCPKCKSGNLPWYKRQEELDTLLKSNFNVIRLSSIPDSQTGYLTVKHLDCNTEYTTLLVGFVSPNTKNRATCPNCRSTDRRVTYNNITFGSQFEYEAYKILEHLTPEVQVPYSNYLPTHRKWVCDFKIGNYWIEVSNFKQDFKNYFQNIEDKRLLVESNSEFIFLFVTSLKELKELVTLM